MNDRVPFFLSEAVVSLYPAAADGGALMQAPVWAGALANELSGERELDEIKIMGAGEAFSTAHHLDEEHLLEIARTWMIRRQTPVDFQPGRNQQYVLELVWLDPFENVWYQRQYFGVTARRSRWQSYGTNHFTTRQSWRAQRFVDNGGIRIPQHGGPPQYSAFVPGSPVPPVLSGPFTQLPGTGDQEIGFFRESPFVNGEYLLGSYRWPVDVSLGAVLAQAVAGQGTATVLRLELNGVLTGPTVTLAAGAPNVTVSGTADFGGLVVPAGTTVRWQIVSGPIPEAACWGASLTMGVTSIS